MLRVSLLILLLTSCISTAKQTGQAPTQPTFKTIKEEEDQIPFSGLIGSWDCVSEDLVDSVWYQNKAFWRWEYILGGHAILNHWWQEDNSLNALTDEYYANGFFIRNKETDQWEAVVMNSRSHKLSPKFKLEFQGTLIKMHDGSGQWQVTFYEITDDSFMWKYEILAANNEWKPISKIIATRKQ